MSAHAAQQQQRQLLQTSQYLHQTLVKDHATHLNIMEALEDDMSMHAENSPETATTTCNHASPSDSDDLSGDGESSPYSSPPPALRNVSFKPFTTSRAQRRAIAEKLSRERLSATANPTSESEGNPTKITNDSPEVFARKTLSNKVAGSTDIKSIINIAKQKALADNKPNKVNRIEELYQRSLHDTRLSAVLGAALRTGATPEGLNELQRYVNETKTMAGVVQHTMPQTNVNADSNTVGAEAGVQAENETAEATDVVQTTKVGQQNPLATFCTSELWPRYCRLPPGRNTSIAFEAMTSITIDNRGQSAPTHPIPDSWLQEVLTQLSRFLQVARAEQRAWMVKVIATPGYRGQDVHVLLVDEVMWAAHRGPFKNRQKRGEIGLLLECVGIERKGATWKG
jgi:hypothetical protein